MCSVAPSESVTVPLPDHSPAKPPNRRHRQHERGADACGLDCLPKKSGTKLHIEFSHSNDVLVPRHVSPHQRFSVAAVCQVQTTATALPAMARNRPSPLGRTKRKLHKPIGTCEGHFRSVEASDCRQFGLSMLPISNRNGREIGMKYQTVILWSRTDFVST